ncbi:M50 family metallopeptidase [Arthrobacter sp. efr-133-TYG-104]|uniref:M50 family metallopeptidase n=1 Tax=Arthrobacter sp. efr-133-TYG-104 TaxID=3040324 RepID=UPI00254B3FB1|nr:M50 family metallopeptidase [Arthrobacter sp. efr-133-TYG-104]
MTITILRRPWPVVLKPGLLPLFAAMSLGGGLLIASQRSKLTGQMVLSWQEAALTGVLVVAGLILHETGHAVAAQATGRKVERLEFGLAAGAVTSGDTTPWRRVIAIAAGPISDLVFGSALWAAGGGVWDNPLGAAGFFVLFNGAGNVLPLHKALDGCRLLRFLRLALRGNAPLGCIPKGPCPACTGAATEPARPGEPALIPSGQPGD